MILKEGLYSHNGARNYRLGICCLLQDFPKCGSGPPLEDGLSLQTVCEQIRFVATRIVRELKNFRKALLGMKPEGRYCSYFVRLLKAGGLLWVAGDLSLLRSVAGNLSFVTQSC